MHLVHGTDHVFRGIPSIILFPFVFHSNYEFQFRILNVKLAEKKILNFPSANVHFN